MLDAFAHLVRGVMHRAGALQHVLATSALVDHDAAEMLEVTRRQRHLGQCRIVRDLAREGRSGRAHAKPRPPTSSTR